MPKEFSFDWNGRETCSFDYGASQVLCEVASPPFSDLLVCTIALGVIMRHSEIGLAVDLPETNWTSNSVTNWAGFS